MLRPMSDTKPPTKDQIHTVCQAYSPLDDRYVELSALDGDAAELFWAWDGLLRALRFEHDFIPGDTICQQMVEQFMTQNRPPASTYCELVGVREIPREIQLPMQKIYSLACFGFDKRVYTDTPASTQSTIRVDQLKRPYSNSYASRCDERDTMADMLFEAAAGKDGGLVWISGSMRVFAGQPRFSLYIRMEAPQLPADINWLFSNLNEPFVYTVPFQQGTPAITQYSEMLPVALAKLVQQQLKQRHTDLTIRLAAPAATDMSV